MIIIFDFDGTIVDTVKDVVDSFNDALSQYGFPGYTVDSFNRFVGGDLETIVSNLLPVDCVTRENVDNVKKAYRKSYLSSPKPNSKPYEGIMELLLELKNNGHKLAVNSNKGQALLEDMIDKIFPANMFDAVVGYLESRPSKPDRYGVDLIIEQCADDTGEVIYVGDGRSDVLTAKNAEIPCVFCHWGQGTLDKTLYDNTVEAYSVAELKAILLR